MKDLSTLNGEKSLSVIRDFCEAAAGEKISRELEEKRLNAQKAVSHLDEIFTGNDIDVNVNCRANCSNNQT